MFSKFNRFLRDESGATAIEYGLIAAGIAVVVIGAVTTIGSDLDSTFTTIGDSLADGGGAPATPNTGTDTGNN